MSNLVHVLSLWCRCGRTLPTRGSVSWIVADQLGANAPENATADQRHRLLVQALAAKNFSDLQDDLWLEFVTMATGNDFYRLTEDEATNRANHAIARAIIALSHQLPYQRVAFNVIADALIEALQAAEGVEQAVTAACHKLHALYATRPRYRLERRFYERKMADEGRDYRVFQYEAPRDQRELRSTLAAVRNLNDFKTTFVNFALFDTTSHAEALHVEWRILRLLQTPHNVQPVQRLYDDSVAETADALGQLTAGDVDLSLIFRDADEYRTIWARKMKDKLDGHPTLALKDVE